MEALTTVIGRHIVSRTSNILILKYSQNMLSILYLSVIKNYVIIIIGIRYVIKLIINNNYDRLSFCVLRSIFLS